MQSSMGTNSKEDHILLRGTKYLKHGLDFLYPKFEASNKVPVCLCCCVSNVVRVL